MSSNIILIKDLNKSNIQTLANAISKGSLCVIPTETVYGLAGNGLDETAIQKIYEAKGRPSDNPLILHVSDIKMAESITKNIDKDAYLLMETFWPGPLTLVLNQDEMVPERVTGGLNTVGVRMPNIKEIRALIKASKVPLAAPSANLSGKPSSTRFIHILNDFKDKIPYMIDGGDSKIGLESTVLDCTVKPFTILRQGSITQKNLEAVLKRPVLLAQKTNGTPKSPGVKYQHYQPQGNVFLIHQETLSQGIDLNEGILIYTLEDDVSKIKGKKISLGSQKYPESMDQNLYQALREADHPKIKKVYVLMNDSMSEALLDRLSKAASSERTFHD